ncbi:hypothetical protein EDC39_11416 [Geothermobacter ehrlichii]|uniref:Uncharacterized protein n=1 Tax=Geothermobacter ehrlichii TaxID=213224 RepID=A0A5D3WFA2_9BACT|nr:hypothetical protein [Geothermobacter ehrlichii]TYO96311.1 hypothetical protein EDC39_11416 [Geothermobacter ehrlichii]
MNKIIYDNILQNEFAWAIEAYNTLRSGEALLKESKEYKEKWKKCVAIRKENTSHTITEEEKEFMLWGAFYQKALLLAAFGIENLIKGLWIVENNISLKTKNETYTKLPNELKTHNLHQIDIKINFSPKERQVLIELSNYIKWVGRYPVALNSVQFCSERFRNPGIQYYIEDAVVNKTNLECFPDEIYSIYNKLISEIKSKKSNNVIKRNEDTVAVLE